MEIEHVDVDVLEQIDSFFNVQVHPSARTIRIIQDELTQKHHFQAHTLLVARFLPIEAATKSGTCYCTTRITPDAQKSDFGV